jgi:hypothetical protein
MGKESFRGSNGDFSAFDHPLDGSPHVDTINTPNGFPGVAARCPGMAFDSGM